MKAGAATLRPENAPKVCLKDWWAKEGLSLPSVRNTLLRRAGLPVPPLAHFPIINESFSLSLSKVVNGDARKFEHARPWAVSTTRTNLPEPASGTFLIAGLVGLTDLG